MDTQRKVTWPGWENVRMIGRGSFGTVYEIQRRIFDAEEKAALKYISIPQNVSDIEEMYGEGYDDESVSNTLKSHLQDIIAEYSMMCKIGGCSNVVKCENVHYQQHENGLGWDVLIKMELLTPLLKAIAEEIPEEQVVKIGKDICKALVACQEYNIVHRDIKPQNIFVSKYGDYKLGDFGIAKTVEKTMGGTKIGTYKYMAPEVYHNQPYGRASDIYSLGLVLYWLLNERRMPFVPLPPVKLTPGVEEEARLRRFSGEELPLPQNGSRELQRIVMKACAYNPNERFSSAQEMFEALNRLDIQEDEGTIGVVPISQHPEKIVVVPDEEKQNPDPQPNTPTDEAPLQGDQPKKKVVPLFGVVAGVVICVIICSVLMLSRLSLPVFGKTQEPQDNDGRDEPSQQQLVQYDGHYYYIFDEKIESYEGALEFCNHLGGYLADVNSREENVFLYEYLSSMGYDHIFLGGSDAQEDGVWLWESGEPFDYQNWNEGEPNNDLGGEDHLAMYHVLSDGSWNDIMFSTPSCRSDTAVIVGTEASSYCTDPQKNCSVEHLSDGKPETSWCVAESTSGIGEYILFNFRKKERLTGMTIGFGNQENDHPYLHPKTIKLVFDDGSNRIIELEDMVSEQFIAFDEVVITDSVKIVFVSAYDTDADCSITVSDVFFHSEARKTGFLCEWKDEASAKAALEAFS